MRSVLLCAAAAAFAVTSAQAADLMPVKAPPAVIAPAPSWNGFYVGLFAGYGWGDGRATAPFDANTGFFYNWTGDPYTLDAKGFFGGGTIGHNWQSGVVVVGLEGEVGYLGLRGSAVDPNFEPDTIPIGDTVTRFKSDLYGAIYGRLGIASGNGLFYGKGGIAFLNAEASTIDPCAGTPGCGTTTLTMTGSKLMVGWSAGAGAEWLFGANWSAKAEYAYFDFGKIATAGPSSFPGEFYRQTIELTVHTVKFGLNYRLSGPLMTSGPRR